MQFVVRSFELALNPSTQLARTVKGPDPNVSVEQKLHFWSAVQRRNAPMGPTISPDTSMESFMHPSHEVLCFALAGIISATGLPKRVTVTGAPVRLTSSRTARQVALNLEIAMSRII